MPKLHYNTVSDRLVHILKRCMADQTFNAFRLVGGTALSLQRGHRQSDDIDLFTDSAYQSIYFEAIESWLKSSFRYVHCSGVLPVGIGKPYFIGDNPADSIKVDLYYTETFIEEPTIIDGIRLAGLHDIIAMKMEVISGAGRKKDFWDIHELLDDYTVQNLISIHKQRYPYTHDPHLLRRKLTDFHQADSDFTPRCLRGKHWELIKLDIMERLQR